MDIPTGRGEKMMLMINRKNYMYGVKYTCIE